MAKRLYEISIWNEDWFLDLPENYKLFWLYLWGNCEVGGVWKPNKRVFLMISSKHINLNEFLKMVNKEEERIVILENKKWLIPDHFYSTVSSVINLKNSAHIGAIRLWSENNIIPKMLPKMSLKGGRDNSMTIVSFISLDNQSFKNWALGGPQTTLYKRIENKINSLKKEIEIEIEDKGVGKGERERERKKNFLSGEGERENPEIKKNENEKTQIENSPPQKVISADRPNFPMQQLYEKSFSDLQELKKNGGVISGRMGELSENGFRVWKKFVDWVKTNHHEDLFICKFPGPAEFEDIYVSKGFTESWWQPTIERIKSTGIKPSQYLVYRLPQFMGYLKKEQGNLPNKQITVMDSGDADYDNQETW